MLGDRGDLEPGAERAIGVRAGPGRSPGRGVVEEEESPHAACRREVAEETGLDRVPGRLLVVDWVPSRPERPEGLILWFPNGSVITDDNVLLVDETFGNRITAFDLTLDGELTNRRAWATFGDRPNGSELSAVFTQLVVAPDGRTLFACVAPDFDEHARSAAREARLLAVRVDLPHAGRP
ncbi:MAG: NUDIX hydrolase [Streptosporangiaceae bacterium]|jgi:ADP-ribose pyrophosphatase YjhB (NUDIX family)